MNARLYCSLLALGSLIGCAHTATKPVVKPSEVRVTTKRFDVKRCRFIRDVYVDSGVPLSDSLTPRPAPLTIRNVEELRKVTAEAGGDTVLAILEDKESFQADALAGEAYLCRK